eukprot:scaffold1410_cov154-Amphora_coffeaeformis.AAC.4
MRIPHLQHASLIATEDTLMNGIKDQCRHGGILSMYPQDLQDGRRVGTYDLEGSRNGGHYQDLGGIDGGRYPRGRRWGPSMSQMQPCRRIKQGQIIKLDMSGGVNRRGQSVGLAAGAITTGPRTTDA